MDIFDAKILDLLQTDCTLPHAAIGERVGLSGSAVRRRIQALRKQGVIAREVAILSEKAAPRGVAVLALMSFTRESVPAYEAFRKAMRADPCVLQCHATSGPVDFALLVVVEDPAAYEAWGERVLAAHPELRRFDSHVVWSTVKFTTKRTLAPASTRSRSVRSR
ncbi:MAG: Lrp/AsnC family transcriptional regulator [Parvularculaceae bacterium]|nr:Lrp/AsnC family transcriptional regulator [Parvularculaceae bacterium]